MRIEAQCTHPEQGHTKTCVLLLLLPKHTAPTAEHRRSVGGLVAKEAPGLRLAKGGGAGAKGTLRSPKG
jgi:hypothetical protein